MIPSSKSPTQTWSCFIVFNALDLPLKTALCIVYIKHMYIINDICIHITLYILHSTLYNTIINIYSLIWFSVFYISFKVSFQKNEIFKNVSSTY